jgi:beta-phosphoglucomutase
VITDTARYHYLAWKRLADDEGIRFDEVFNQRLKGVDRMGSLEIILGQSGKTYTASEKVALAEAKNDYYRQMIAVMTPDDLLPGAMAALVSTREAGLKIGLASVSKNAPTVLERLGIADRFDCVVDAQTISRGKPDPEIFLTAAECLHVPPDLCIGVEDAIAGIQAIKAAGMYAIGVGDPRVLRQADQVIPGLYAFDIALLRAGGGHEV